MDDGTTAYIVPLAPDGILLPFPRNAEYHKISLEGQGRGRWVTWSADLKASTCLTSLDLYEVDIKMFVITWATALRTLQCVKCSTLETISGENAKLDICVRQCSVFRHLPYVAHDVEVESCEMLQIAKIARYNNLWIEMRVSAKTTGSANRVHMETCSVTLAVRQVRTLRLDNSNVESIRFSHPTELETFIAECNLTSWPGNVFFYSLTKLVLRAPTLESLPEDFALLVPQLRSLTLTGIPKLPVLPNMPLSLEELTYDGRLALALPENLGDLRLLRRLQFRAARVLPYSIGNLQSLQILRGDTVGDLPLSVAFLPPCATIEVAVRSRNVHINRIWRRRAWNRMRELKNVLLHSHEHKIC